MKNLVLILFIPASVCAQDPLQYVDPLIGTAPAGTISALRHSESSTETAGRPFGR